MMFVCGTVVSACSAAKQFEHVRAIVAAMMRHGPSPDLSTLTEAITAHTRARLWEQAVGLVVDLRRGGMRPDVFASRAILSVWEVASAWKAALQELVVMSDRSWQVSEIAYNATVSACLKGRQWQQAVVLVAE